MASSTPKDMPQYLPKNAKPWLEAASLIAVFDAIDAAGGEIRVNGGAVRNSLMGIEVGDIDLSTTLPPLLTVKAIESAGLKAVPTGLQHGTITAVSNGIGYEITTLREDIETDGRHAVVKFGTDWSLDAKRRDLTMNALYCDRTGKLFDPLNGYPDLATKTVRFIGEASERIEEDFLRILRFFRFFGWYGDGRPDAEGLKACARLKHGLEDISVERIWMELRKLLSAPDPSRALLWMRTTGVLNLIVPESEKWGIDLVPHLMAAEVAHGWLPDPLLRLAAIVRPNGPIVSAMTKRLRLSSVDQSTLGQWADLPPLDQKMDKAAFSKRLYREGTVSLMMATKLEIAKKYQAGEGQSNLAKNLIGLINFANRWQRPVFPVKGKDLLKKGYSAGPEMGKQLVKLETRWLQSGFQLSKADLLDNI